MKSRTNHGVALCLAIIFLAPFAEASSTQPALCERASERAAALHDIPQHILQTLALAESGKTVDGVLRPWPWAINRAGEGHWFASQDEMLAFAEALVAAGTTNFDIGCFQLNYRWHGQEFASLAQMSDPDSNAAYAASFLRSKYAATGAWKSAVGAYHSQTEDHATAYVARFEALFARWGAAGYVPEDGNDVSQTGTALPTNSFPLLIAGRASTGPSLVPITERRARLIGGDE